MKKALYAIIASGLIASLMIIPYQIFADDKGGWKAAVHNLQNQINALVAQVNSIVTSQLIEQSASSSDVDTNTQFSFTCTNGAFQMQGVNFDVQNFSGKSITATVASNGVTLATTNPISDSSVVIYNIVGDGFGPNFPYAPSTSGTVITVTFNEGSDSGNEAANVTFVALTNSNNVCTAS